jgi:hypothetical protein
LEFLTLSGGIPDAIARSELMRLAEAATSGSAFAIAQKLAASVYLGDIFVAQRWCLALLDLQCIDGSWPSSLELCVPHQHDPSQVDVQCDDRRLLTTAASLVALTRWSELDARGANSPDVQRRGTPARREPTHTLDGRAGHAAGALGTERMRSLGDCAR